MECIFCKVVNNEINASIIYENQDILGFTDINPQAPNHILFIPKKHISTLNDISDDDTLLAGKLIIAAQQYAKKISADENGYRIVMNCNNDGGQTVYHIHLHFLAGRKMNWPPG
jgi:histidine triad (HIT) family protein